MGRRRSFHSHDAREKLASSSQPLADPRSAPGAEREREIGVFTRTRPERSTEPYRRCDDRASEDAGRENKPGLCSQPTTRVNRESDRVGRPHTLLFAALILGACARSPSSGISNDADAALDADAVIEDATAVTEVAMFDVLSDTPRDVFVDVPPDVRYLRCADLERVYGCRGTIRMCFPNNPNGDVGPCDEPTPYPSCVGSTGGPYCRTGDEAWDWRCQCNPTSLSNREGVWNCKVRVVCNGDASVWPR